jgi:TRAP-type C4-dicarboxylate transport system permease small subunit
MISMKKTDRVIKTTTNILCWMGEAVIMVMMFGICADILGRTFFNHPIMGVPDIMAACLPLIVFFVIPTCTRERQHVRATMIVDRLPKKGQYVAEIAATSIGVVFFAVLIYASWRPMIEATRVLHYSGAGFKVPVFPIYYLIEIGSALCLYYCVRRIIQLVGVLRGRISEADADDSQLQEGGTQI